MKHDYAAALEAFNDAEKNGMAVEYLQRVHKEAIINALRIADALDYFEQETKRFSICDALKDLHFREIEL